MNKSTVILCCSVKGCPRQLKPMLILVDEGMPKGTTAVMQPCPWHIEEGDKTDGASYWDKNHKELIKE